MNAPRRNTTSPITVTNTVKPVDASAILGSLPSPQVLRTTPTYYLGMQRDGSWERDVQIVSWLISLLQDPHTPLDSYSQRVVWNMGRDPKGNATLSLSFHDGVNSRPGREQGTSADSWIVMSGSGRLEVSSFRLAALQVCPVYEVPEDWAQHWMGDPA